MSVIIESQPGDKLVCIASFSAAPKGEPFVWETSRTFKIGERVRYLSHYREERDKDYPAGWLVVVKAADGKEYAATQTYFVTRAVWRNLEAHVSVTVGRLAAKLFRLLWRKPIRSLRKRLRGRNQGQPHPPLPPRG